MQKPLQIAALQSTNCVRCMQLYQSSLQLASARHSSRPGVAWTMQEEVIHYSIDGAVTAGRTKKLIAHSSHQRSVWTALAEEA